MWPRCPSRGKHKTRCTASSGSLQIPVGLAQIFLLERLHLRHPLQFENLFDRDDALVDIVNTAIGPDLGEHLPHRGDSRTDRMIAVDDHADIAELADPRLG